MDRFDYFYRDYVGSAWALTLKIAADEHIAYLDYYFSGQAELQRFSGRNLSFTDVEDADVLLVRSVTAVNAETLENSRVRFVGSVTAGFDHLDLAGLQKKGITVQLAHGFNAQPVADYVVCVLLALHKKHRIPFDKSLKVAVIGIGAVGSRVVKHMRALGVEVRSYDPPRAESDHQFQSCSWEEVVSADVTSVHVPWTRAGKHATHAFLNRHFFQQLKPGAILINASRGEVLHETDFLQNGQHVHLCSDVWMNEPHCNVELLQRAELASPHIAGYSWQSKCRGLHLLYLAMQQAGFTLQPRTMPVAVDTDVTLHGKNWMDVILSVFDPRPLSAAFKRALLQAENPAHAFDTWRRNYPLRHEFASLTCEASDLSTDDCEQLRALGMQLIRAKPIHNI